MTEQVEVKPKKQKKDPKQLSEERKNNLKKGREKLAMLRQKAKKQYIYEYEDDNDNEDEDENEDDEEDENGYVVKPLKQQKKKKQKKIINHAPYLEISRLEGKIDSLSSRLDSIHEKRKPKRRLARSPKIKVELKEEKKTQPKFLTLQEQLLQTLRT